MQEAAKSVEEEETPLCRKWRPTGSPETDQHSDLSLVRFVEETSDDADGSGRAKSIISESVCLVPVTNMDSKQGDCL